MNRCAFFRADAGPFKALALAVLCAACPVGTAPAANVTIEQLPRVSSQPGEPRLNEEALTGVAQPPPKPPGRPNEPQLTPETRKGTTQHLLGTPIRPSAPDPGLLEFAPCHQPGIKRVARVVGKSTAVVSALHTHDLVALIGCGFGDQSGKVELLGRLLGSVANPFPERLPAKVVEWRPNAILVEILPPEVPVTDQRIDILVRPPATPVPPPKYGIWWRSAPWFVPPTW